MKKCHWKNEECNWKIPRIKWKPQYNFAEPLEQTKQGLRGKCIAVCSSIMNSELQTNDATKSRQTKIRDEHNEKDIKRIYQRLGSLKI